MFGIPILPPHEHIAVVRKMRFEIILTVFTGKKLWKVICFVDIITLYRGNVQEENITVECIMSK